MIKYSFAILTGICLLQHAANLPAWAGWGSCVGALALAVVLRVGRVFVTGIYSRAACMLCMLLTMTLFGYTYAAWRADIRMSESLPSELEGTDLSVVGVIASLPEKTEDGMRFVFEVSQYDGNPPGSLPETVLLSWFQGTHAAEGFQSGERWNLTVRLKRPHGNATPGAFDYEAWLLQRGIRATGSVRGRGKRLDKNAGGFSNTANRIRARIRDNFRAALPDAPYQGILIALAVGDQNAIPDGQWEVMRRTGIQHLVAISGLHVSMAALAVGWLVAALWRRVPRATLRYPARLVGVAVGLPASCVYAVIAGMGIPVQRSLVMLATGAACLLLRREMSARQLLAITLAAVLLFDPWAPLAAGFWLSFGAVAIILLCVAGRVAPSGGFIAAARLQGAITFATIPLLVWLFQGFSVAAPLANAVAIPMVSFVIAPLVVFSALWPMTWALELAHWLTEVMMWVLKTLAASPLAFAEQPLPPLWLLVTAVVVAFVCVLPRGTTGRLAAFALLIGFLAWRPERPPLGEFRAAILDVGQGLSVHVQTESHDFLFDAGPAMGTTDAGERIVYPYLRASGVKKLDVAAISHDDADHAGGLASLQKRMEISEVLAGDNATALPAVESAARKASAKRKNPFNTAVEPVLGTPCVKGHRWQWEGVDFEVLAPEKLPAGRRDNAGSCVIRIRAIDGPTLILTGDADAKSENRLVQRQGTDLSSTVVVAGHHGSRSSSSEGFVAATHPRWAIISAGYLNRYGHPHAEVVKRWEAVDARILRTDRDGSILLETSRGALNARMWRKIEPRYWHGG